MSNLEMQYSQRKYGCSNVNSEILDNDLDFQKYLVEHWKPRIVELETLKAENEKVHRGWEKSLQTAEAKFNSISQDFEEVDPEYVTAIREVERWRGINSLNDTTSLNVQEELNNTYEAVANCEKRIRAIKRRAEIAGKRKATEGTQK